MDPATLASIAVIARTAAQMLQDYNTGAKTPEEIAAAWAALGISQDVTGQLLRDAAIQGGYTVPS